MLLHADLGGQLTIAVPIICNVKNFILYFYSILLFRLSLHSHISFVSVANIYQLDWPVAAN